MQNEQVGQKLIVMPYPYYRGAYNAPAGIRRLPLALLRDPYPRRPQQTAAAAHEYLEGRNPPMMLLPQRMGFTKWKTPPYDVGWGMNVVALVDALEQGVNQVRGLYHAAAAQAPTSPERQTVAERSFNPLPQVSDNLDPNLNAPAYARDVLPMDRYTSAESLTSFVRAHRQNLESRNLARDERLRMAMQSAGLMQDRVADILDSTDNLPWFMQRREST